MLVNFEGIQEENKAKKTLDAEHANYRIGHTDKHTD